MLSPAAVEDRDRPQSGLHPARAGPHRHPEQAGTSSSSSMAGPPSTRSWRTSAKTSHPTCAGSAASSSPPSRWSARTLRDYTVRNLVGIDPASKVIAIAEAVHEGGKVRFCRRDRESAVKDMRRMTANLKRRIGNAVDPWRALHLLRGARAESVRGARARNGDHPRHPRRVSHGRFLRRRRAEPGPDLRLYRGVDAVSLTSGRDLSGRRPRPPVSDRHRPRACRPARCE